MKGDRISSNIRNVRAHDLRSNDLRTKNIIILCASWRGNQKERWRKAVFLDSEAPYASAAWLFFNGSWLHIPIRIATNPISFPSCSICNHELHVLNAKQNKLQQIESWLSRESFRINCDTDVDIFKRVHTYMIFSKRLINNYFIEK